MCHLGDYTGDAEDEDAAAAAADGMMMMVMMMMMMMMMNDDGPVTVTAVSLNLPWKEHSFAFFGIWFHVLTKYSLGRHINKYRHQKHIQGRVWYRIKISVTKSL